MEPVSVEVLDIVSRVRMSGDEELSEPALRRIVAAVLDAVRAEQAHDQRRRCEQAPLGSALHRGEVG
jgi:hypothetical protein